ncbi:acid ceramidase isoform X1 [Rhineura floridana]|uniref:acid ceramidase isoform X1 n=2 Tax=Rhineura floridana TaxID=261503 RepID=UPI002AC835D0|nr:acid ceramidase isoform X1 [Rhineura floridana]
MERSTSEHLTSFRFLCLVLVNFAGLGHVTKEQLLLLRRAESHVTLLHCPLPPPLASKWGCHGSDNRNPADCKKMRVLVVIVVAVASVWAAVLAKDPFAEECKTHEYPPSGPTYKGKIPTYIINLDLPPSERWAQMARDKKVEMKSMIKSMKDMVAAFLRSEKLIASLESKLAWLGSTLPYPFNEEVKGIASAIESPLGDMVVFNVFYEIFTLCTSIVAEDKTGKLYHARNLDFGLFLGWDVHNSSWIITMKLKPLMVSLDFQKNNKTVFKSANLAGYVGMVSGVRPGAFTLTMNERFSLDGGYVGLFEWILGQRNGWWMSFLTRTVLENSTSYEDAKDKLANTKLLAPAYFILAGNKSGEGCVITRSRVSALDIWTLDPEGGVWYVLETNYDRWKDPLILDDRRGPTMRCLNQTKQENLSSSAMYNILSTKPILNKLTVATTLMEVSEGRIETYLRECPDPCSPW